MSLFQKKHLSAAAILLLNIVASRAQVGGEGVYKFLEIPNSARVASLGGKNVSLNDGDLNLAYHNPSLLTPDMDKSVVLNGVSYFAGIGFGYAAYAFNADSVGTFALGLHYANYGTFQGADKYGVKTQSFEASDYAFNIMYSKALDSSFRVGINIKPLYSSYERYNSFGIATDIGVNWTGQNGLLSAGLVVRDLGFQIDPYTDNKEKLPLEILLGITKRLEHAPFRLSLTLHNLHRYNMLYTVADESNSDLFQTQTQVESKAEKFSDNLFRHVIAGIEFLPSKSFYVSLAYNYQRRMELALKDAPGSVGFSYGAGIRIKKISLAYGRSVYHMAGGSNHFSAVIHLGEGIRR